jgi:hypothetical protein
LTGYRTEEEKRNNEQQYTVLGSSEGLYQDNGYEFNEELQHEENDEDNRVNLKCALPT